MTKTFMAKYNAALIFICLSTQHIVSRIADGIMMLDKKLSIKESMYIRKINLLRTMDIFVSSSKSRTMIEHTKKKISGSFTRQEFKKDRLSLGGLQ